MPPVGAAIAAVGAAISGTVAAISAFAASSFIASMIVNTAISVGISLIARALTPKPTIKQSGIQTAVTTTGGTEPQGFILGRTATAGHHVCPPMSHDDGGTPNGFLTYVVELSDLPGIGFSRVILNDGYSVLGTTAHPDYGFPLLGQRIGGTDHAWIKFYDGNQIAADPMLVAKYANYPDRPWSESFIGHGTAYAILTFRYNREVFNNLPTVRFELDGIPLYDPRFDSSVGGSGSQRWSNPATWTHSANPTVMIYNILRGIRLPTGEVWGGDVPADDLPLDNWIAAMNACDAPIGSRASFVAGLEVKLEMEPAEVIDELAKTCLGQVSEMGGVFRMRVGAPAAPMQFITDEDIVISAPQELDPFPGLAASANAIASDYPEPASLWTSRAAPPLFNPTWEAEDGGRRLSTSLNFPACSDVSQVAQLMSAYIKDARRFRTHRLVLPPEAFLLEPLDTIAWTSARNGYTNKIFEVVEITDQPGTINQELVLRERDPSDYGWTSAQDLPAVVPVTGLASRPPQIIAGWAVAANTLKDALGLDRRPAITLSWVGSAALDALFVRYEIRLKATTQVVASGLADRAAGSVLVSEGLLPNTAYEVRGRYVLDRPSDWSSWLDVTTPGVYLNGDDLRGGIKGLMDEASLAPVEILSSLPETSNIPGRVVFLTSDAKLYRWTGSAWTAAVPAVDITGQIAETQISDASITTPKIAAGSIEGDKLAANTITGNKIVANTITGGLLATSGIITQVAQIGDGLITNAKIADAAITRAKIGAAAIGTAEIANGAITNALIGNAAITSAKIGDLQVNSAKIADLTVGTEKITGNAVTSAGAAYGSIGSLTRYVWTTVASLNLSTLGARVISFTASGDCLGNNIRILVNGVVVRQLAIAIRTAVSGGEAAFVSYFPGSYSTTVAATSTAGSTLLQIQAYKSDQEYTGSADGYITAIELKK